MANAAGLLVRSLAGLLFTALAAGSAAAQAPAPQSITVAIADDLLPSAIVDEDGRLAGMRPEMWALWSRATGIAVRFVPVHGSDSLNLVSRGGADVADPVIFRQDVAARLELSPAYFDSSVHAFYNSDLGGITDAHSLRGYAVAATERGACKDWLVEHGVANVRVFREPEAMVRAVIGHELEVFCTGRISALSYLVRMGVADRVRYGPRLFSAHFHWGVRKGETALRDIIQAGFERIPQAEIDGVNERWLGNLPEDLWRPQMLKTGAEAGLAVLLGGLALVAWNRSLRRRVAAAMAEHRKLSGHLEALLANLPGVVYRARLSPTERELTYLSDGFERQYGLPAARFQAMSLAERAHMVHPDDRAAFVARWEEMSAKGEVVARARFLRPDGQVRWFEYHERMVERHGDDLIAEGLVLDVTEEEDARRALHDREAVFATVAAQAPGGVVLVDCETKRFVEFNDAACHDLGYSREEFARLDLHDIAEMSKGHCGECRCHYDGLGSSMFEIRHRRRDGSLREVQVNSAPIEIAGRRHCVAIWTDISERKRREEAVRHSEAALKEAQRIALIGNWELDLASGGLTWSDEVFRIFELDPREFGASYQAFLDVIHPDDRGLVDSAYTDSVKNKVPYDIVHRLLMKDGRIKYVNERCETVYDGDGHPLRSIGTVQDITRRQLAEQQLEAERRRFEDLVSILPVGVFEDAPGIGNVYVNRQWLAWIGRTAEEVAGDKWAAGIHPDDVDRVRRGWSEAVAHRRPFSSERRMVTPGGKVTWVQTLAVPRFGADGAFIGYVGAATDITDRRRIEEALRFVAQQGWCVQSGEFQPALARYLGEAVGADYVIIDALCEEPGMAETVALYAKGEVAPNLRYALAGTPCANIVDKGICCYPSGVQNLFPEDAMLADMGIESYVGIPLWDSDGKVLGLIAIMDGRPLDDRADFAVMLLQVVATCAAAELERERARAAEERHREERHRLEQQIHEARKLESLGRLAGGIAHDFNNILGAILGFARFVSEDTPADQQGHRHAARIISAAERGRRLVEQILIFARRTKAERTRFLLADLVAECEPLVLIAISSSISLVVECRAPLAAVEANRDQLAQVLMNLCFNARDALEGRNGTIAIRVDMLAAGDPLVVRAASGPPETADDTGVWREADGTIVAMAGRCRPGEPYAVLFVTDSGAGIDATAMSNIFDPFFTTKPVGKGTGLGLAVVQGIVAEHDGVVTVHSRPSEGCEFRVLLPLAEAAAIDIAAAPDMGAADAGSGRILLVDDDRDFGDMLAHMLGRRGWRVSACTTPEAALEAFATEPMAWSVLVTDQVMPNMRGQDLIAKVKAVRHDLPCILCTGYDGSMTDAHAKGFGVAALLYKPFEPEALIDAIMAACEAAPS